MKKTLAIVLTMALIFNLFPTLPFADGQPGPGEDLSVSGNETISGNRNYNNLTIENQATLTIIAGEQGPSRISVSSSLTVNGSLVADPEQRLEIREGCIVTGLSLYESDGTTTFTTPVDRHVEFEYRDVGEEGNSWVLLPPGPGPGEDLSVSGNETISGNRNYNNLTIENQATLTIIAGEQGPSRISVSSSLTVNGSLVADPEQRLEIREGCIVTGLSLYESDGTTTFTTPVDRHVEFEYRDVGEEGNSWVLLPPGPGPGPGEDLSVSGNETISGNRNYNNLTIENQATLTIIAGEQGPSRISVSSSLTVNGSLVADPEQRLEIREGCTVTGLSLYESDGTATFTTPVNSHVEFEYRDVGEEGKRWVLLQPGPGPGTQYNITLNYDNAQGMVLLNGHHENGVSPFNEGSNISIEIQVSQGYKISDVKIDGQSKGSITSDEINNIQEAHTIEVTFSLLTYTITATADEGGTISPSGSQEVLYDSDISFTITPNNGYRIKDIEVDGISEGDRSEYTFNHVREDHTIQATFEKIGNDTKHTITVIPTLNGEVKVGDLVLNGDSGNTVEVMDGYNQEFTIIPGTGYYIFSIIAKEEDDPEGWDYIKNIEYKGNGIFSFSTFEVFKNLTLEVTFKENNIEELFAKSFAVVGTDTSDVGQITSALSVELATIGFVINSENITVSNINVSTISSNGYGTFDFTLKIDDIESSTQTGYIVPNPDDVLFKFYGTNNGVDVNEVRVAHSADGENKIFSAPAMTSGFMECFGPGYTGYEGWTSEDTRDAFGDLIGSNKLPIKKAFYRVQLHITGNHLNWFAFDLIQDNAYCLEVSAASGEGGEAVQETCTWNLNKYAEVTERTYTSNVFFGNKIFTITAPKSGIGGISSFTIQTGEYPGYKITKDDSSGEYSVEFLSDFYNKVTLDILINGQHTRQLIVNRVGVNIAEYENPGPPQIFHGTQNGTAINYDDGNNYRVYATYYIPDFGVEAPYGLYVTYYWANGDITTKIIKQHLKDGNPYANAPVDNGIFKYAGNNNDGLVNCCDYLLHSSTDKNGAPIKIGVTVLSAEPNNGNTFGGVDFGSGSGVEWIRK